MTNLSFADTVRAMAWYLAENERLKDPRASLTPPQSLEDYLAEFHSDLETIRRHDPAEEGARICEEVGGNGQE